MKRIQISSFQSTNLISDFNQINTIEIEDKPFSEGAFGEVYFCISINNKGTTTPQIIKIFKENSSGSAELNYNTIQKLQKVLSKKNDELLQRQNKTLLEELPAFLAIPQFSFIGMVNGLKVKGFSSNNLKSLGFVEFKEVLDDDQLLDNYQSLPIEKKMLIAFQFVSAFKVLKECSFIHADIKPEAIFINIQKDTCAIIDYDSGVITEKIGDEATTWGAWNDWVAPEILKQLDPVSNQQRTIQVDLLTDTWSVAIGIHYFFVTCHPLFYLTELSPRTIQEYFINHKNKWPNINKSAPYFKQEHSQTYDKYLNILNNQVPPEVKDKLSNTINQGYLNPALRTSYDNWKITLARAQKPPLILDFSPSRNYFIKGIETILFWKVENAHTIQIDNGIGVVLGNKISVRPNKDTEYKLTAIGYFGTVTRSLELKVFPTPILEQLIVPIPDFNSRVNLNPIQISSPKIDVSMKINFMNEKPRFINQSFDLQTTNATFKPKQPLFSLSRIFNDIKKSIRWVR